MIDKNKLIELDKRKGALDEYVYVKHKNVELNIVLKCLLKTQLTKDMAKY